MTDHAIAGLRKRREEITGQVHDAETRVTKLRAALANLDAAIAILSARASGLSRPTKSTTGAASISNVTSWPVSSAEALRDASKPLAAGEIAATSSRLRGSRTPAILAVTNDDCGEAWSHDAAR